MPHPDLLQHDSVEGNMETAALDDSYTSVNVGLVSMRGFPYAIEDNYRRLEAYVRDAANRGAKLVIAPEGVLDGYVCASATSRRRMLSVAQRVPDGSYIVRAASMCHKLDIHLVFGFLEQVEEHDSRTRMRNSCVMISPSGNVIAIYSKVFPQTEQWIDAGRRMLCEKTPFGRMGMLICADRTVVEHFSPYAAQGTEIIAIPMDGGGGPINTRMMRKEATEGGFAILIANSWSRVIVLQDGTVALEKYHTEGVSVAKIRIRAQKNAVPHVPALVEHTLTRFSDKWDRQGRPTRKERYARRVARRSMAKRQHSTDSFIAGNNFPVGDGMVNLSGSTVSDTGLRDLARFSDQLQGLWLRDCRITDAGVEHLSNLPHLRTLDLQGTICTDLCLRHIAKCLQLRMLDLSRTVIEGDGFQDLCTLEQLTRLRLARCPLNEKTIPDLACLPQLRWLEVSGNMVGSTALGDLCKKCPNLEISVANNISR